MADKREVKTCLYCDKVLIQGEQERNHNWTRRKYCNKVCAGLRSNNMGPKPPPPINWHGLKTIEAISQPELCHSLAIDTKGTPLALPLSRTEDEINRMWEYSKLMGRRQ